MAPLSEEKSPCNCVWLHQEAVGVVNQEALVLHQNKLEGDLRRWEEKTESVLTW